MSSSSTISIGPGFSTPTTLDHRSWLWVASFLSVLYSLICLVARFTAKWDFLWFDDIILCAGYVFALAHWGILFNALSNGLAVSTSTLTTATFRYVSRLYFASRIPLFFAHCLAKISLLVFTRRIFAGDIYKENLFFGAGYGVVILYGVLAILLSSAGCHPGEALIAKTDAVCSHNRGRWAALTILDCLTEILILAMPAWFIHKNELRASKKRIVIFVYMFRVIVIAFSIATTISYFNFVEDGTDNIDIAPVVAWEESLLGFSLISASFPCLRSFLWAFMSRGLVTMYGNNTTSLSYSNSFQLRSLNSVARQVPFRLRPEQHLEYRVDIRGAASSSRNTNRSDASDRQMIIHHEQSYEVMSTSKPGIDDGEGVLWKDVL